MKNGQYKQITEIGLPKNINGIYFKNMNYLERGFKKGHEIEEPVSIIIKGDSKAAFTLENMTKEEFATRLKAACHFIEADAIMIFSEASRWTGTEEEHQFVMERMGDIHGHVNTKDIVTVFIETQGKQIIGTADMEKKGNKRVMKSMEWFVSDIPSEDKALFSNFLPKQKGAA
ncbi:MULTISPECIES: hypothetical protein [Burkholderia cepacia complex]|uniref:hypothetical protein n=1 Tax=Burkholderia cepacia complex TaxID=87882 RepID=UPI00209E3030|nr:MULTISPECIES: hypothetical protein [Burkholderia cepacia complex]MCO8395317.1 hypothetical protein [Burkholderia cenocepacia]MCO8403186.1 hypothetical protein [Burkholderia cenocepacia]MCO8416970.1 hypothetical protein [Burkholderia cenocepacia]MCO8449303.1 hypothetical protein [Burkholderia cenocepacia]MCO8455035.1 hypothetical protein [Burkholderia multivorans]